MKLKENLDYTVSNIGKLFLDFEDQQFHIIKEITINDFVVWNIVKGDLYSFILARNEYKSTFKKNIKRLFKFPFLVIRLFIFISKKTNKNKTAIFFTKSLEKKISKNKYYNMLFDFFLEEKLITDYLYFEFQQNKLKKEPSFIKKNLATNSIYDISKFISFLFWVRRDIRSASAQITTEFTNYISSKGIELKISSRDIQWMIANFYSEYWVYKILFKALKPKSVFLSDEPSTGKSAAAQDCNIVVIELQHGLMENYYARYLYAPIFQSIKDQLITPSCIGIFGDFHQYQLTNKGFILTQKIAILGNHQIEEYRKVTYNYSSTNQTVISFTTQGSFLFDASKQFLNNITESINENFIFKIILHPNETDSNKNWYADFVSRHTNFYLESSINNIYEYIINSDLIISFYSVTLVEAIGLFKPAITISNGYNLLGIHSIIGSEALLDVIKVCDNSQSSFQTILNRYRQDESFRNEWMEKIKLVSDSLYSNDYKNNCYKLIQDFLK